MNTSTVKLKSSRGLCLPGLLDSKADTDCVENEVSLATDERGAIYAEYLVVLTVVALTGAAAVLALGVPLAEAFRFAQVFVALPFP